MKKSISTITLLAAAAAVPFSTVSAVETDPVGFITVTINGTGGQASESFTYLGAPLHKAAASSGGIDASADNLITDSDASWEANAFSNTHYVHITSGTNEGVSATIASNTSTELTTMENLNGFLSGGETFEIRPYTTIADIFGADNEAGLDGGSGAGNADNILIQDGQNFNTYYYKDSGLIGGTGWRSTASSITDASTTPIPFGTGFIVVRRQSANIDITIAGSVFGGDAITPVEEDFNWKTPSIPVAMSLADFFGPNNEAGLDGGSGAGNADTILVPDGSGDFDTYYYKDSGLIGGTGWRSSASSITDESATIIAEPGKMFFLNRSGGSGFNLTESSPL